MTPANVPKSLDACADCGPATKAKKGPQLDADQSTADQAVYVCPAKKCGLVHSVSTRRFKKRGK